MQEERGRERDDGEAGEEEERRKRQERSRIPVDVDSDDSRLSGSSNDNSVKRKKRRVRRTEKQRDRERGRKETEGGSAASDSHYLDEWETEASKNSESEIAQERYDKENGASSSAEALRRDFEAMREELDKAEKEKEKAERLARAETPAPSVVRNLGSAFGARTSETNRNQVSQGGEVGTRIVRFSAADAIVWKYVPDHKLICDLESELFQAQLAGQTPSLVGRWDMSTNKWLERELEVKGYWNREEEHFNQWEWSRFIGVMKLIIPDEGSYGDSQMMDLHQGIDEEIKKMDSRMQMEDRKALRDFFDRVMKRVEAAEAQAPLSETKKKATVKAVLDNLAASGSSPPNDQVMRKIVDKVREMNFLDVGKLQIKILEEVEEERKRILKFLNDHFMPMTWTMSMVMARCKGAVAREVPRAEVRVERGREEAGMLCDGCGRKEHWKDACPLKDHPDWNRQNIPWGHSGVARFLWERKGERRLPWRANAAGEHWPGHPPLPENNQAAAGGGRGGNGGRGGGRGNMVHGYQGNGGRGQGRGRGDGYTHYGPNAQTMYPQPNGSAGNNSIQGKRSVLCMCWGQGRKTIDPQAMICPLVKGFTVYGGETLMFDVLLDTGCMQENFISPGLAEEIERTGRTAVTREARDGMMCMAVKGVRHRTSHVIYFELRLISNETKKITRILNIAATVANVQYDLIVGNELMNEHDLGSMLFTRGEDNKGKDSKESTLMLMAGDTVDMREFLPPGAEDDASLFRNDDGVMYEDPTPEESVIPKCIEGSENLRRLLWQLCEEYEGVFSRKVRKEPAKLAPMKLKVDRKFWQVAENRGPARRNTRERDTELRRQVKIMLELGVIRESQTPHYSQVHMHKQGGKYRFCMDFRALNILSESMGWPIPRIDELLRRIGAHKPKYFCVFDLTAGYHQIKADSDSMQFLAFATSMGIYEWNRLPMGLKGAPGHFQHQMAAVVLAGLIYNVCEVYLDDIIVYGSTEEELLDATRQVLARIQQFGVTLSPDKCKLGVQEVNYVGHRISKDGLHFSKEKLIGVAEFDKPRVQKELRSFLGVVNYFRDHVPHHSDAVRPLHKLIKGSDSKRVIEWTQEAEDAFTGIKNLIVNCPLLFFVDDKSTIYLHTDASDYGIGAYLFQLIDGQERPIRFLSRALSPEQARWSTIEKETWAIVCSLREWDSLLRDTWFVLRTDHKNLLYLGKEESSQKVTRWMMEVREFHCFVEHIPGVKNEAADALSRAGAARVRPTPTSTNGSIDQLAVGRPSAFLATLICPLEEKVYKMIENTHNERLGHMGVEGTIDRLEKRKEDWPTRRRDVTRFVRECLICQKTSFKLKPVFTEPYTNSVYDMREKINIDTVGPWPVTPDGYAHVLVVIDCFTRFVVLYPLRTVQAEEAARTLLGYVCTFGCPNEIQSDGGTQFANEVICELMKLMRTKHTITLAGSSQQNGIVERCNKEVNKHTRVLLGSQPDIGGWFDSIPLVMRILNAAPHKSLGKISPMQLMFGDCRDLDKGFLTDLGGKKGEELIDHPVWLKKLCERQAELSKNAREYLEAKDNKRKEEVSARRTTYEVGDMVLCQYPKNVLRPGPPSKLMAYLQGPWKINHREGDTYTLDNPSTGRDEKVHVTRLQPCEYDRSRVDGTTVALSDTRQFEIEKILSHVGDLRVDPKKKWRFLVRWKYLPESEECYGTWEQLRKTEALHEYLRRIGKGYHIPAGFQTGGDKKGGSTGGREHHCVAHQSEERRKEGQKRTRADTASAEGHGDGHGEGQGDGQGKGQGHGDGHGEGQGDGTARPKRTRRKTRKQLE